MTMDYIPPQNGEAEAAALASILLDPKQIDNIRAVVRPSDFYNPEHASVFAAMCALDDRREPIDMVTLQSEILDPQRGVEDAEGFKHQKLQAHLSNLMGSIAAPSNGPAYAHLVKDASTRRKLIAASQSILKSAISKDMDIREVVAECERELTGATSAFAQMSIQTAREAVDVAFGYVEELSESRKLVTGIPTGITDLDYILRGFQPSTMVVIAAPTGGGKSALAGQFALTAARHFKSERKHKSVLFASLEMSNMQTMLRMLATAAQVDSHRMRTGSLEPEDWRRIGHNFSIISELNMHFCDDPYLTLTSLKIECRKLARQGLGMVVVDYVQMLNADVSIQNRARELDIVAQGLKAIAKEHRITVLVLSQISKASEQRPDKRPQISDLRDSNGIAANADVILFPYNPKMYGPQDEREDCEPVKIIVAKHRDGAVGDARAFWKRKWTFFSNQADDSLESSIPPEEEPRMPYTENLGPVNPMQGWNP